MKKHLIYLAIILLAMPTFAQVRGNSSYERQMKMPAALDNYVHNGIANQQISHGNVSTASANGYFRNDSTFEIEADLMYNRKADSYVAVLSLTQNASTLDSAYLLINQRIDKCLQKLGDVINKKDIYIDFISLVPTFEYVTEKKVFSKSTSIEVPSGYELSKTLHLPYNKPEQLEKIMAAAASGEIYDLVKVDYIVNNMTSIYDSLRKDGIDLILKKKADYERLGIKFNAKFVVVADDITSTYPIERYKSASAFSSSGTGYDKLKKTYTSSKKHTAYYYDRINYNEMDEVVNPNVVEPVVQFMYNIKIRYTLGKL